VVAYVAVLMPVLLGGLGLAIDNGRLYSERRQMQTAADATAIAVAQEWRQSNTEGYETAALEDAALNGFEEGGGVDIDINVPPESGPRAGDSKFVEVIIREEVPLYFMKAFNKASSIVESRAVAGLVPTDACVYVLDPTAQNALLAAGDARLTLEGCGIHVNSDHSQAARTIGGGVISASSVGIVGDYNGTGFFPTPQTGVYSSPDPLAGLAAPSGTSCTYTETVEITTTTTLNPGTYCGGIRVTATGSVTLNSGMYVLKGGGLDVHAGATLTGSGVTFYNTDGPDHGFSPFEFRSTSTSNLTAPSGGTYKGILFFQDRGISTNDDNIFAGTPDTTFTGVLYLPTGNVKYVGTSGTLAQESMLMARTVEFRGTADVRMFAEDTDVLPTALSVARVVE